MTSRTMLFVERELAQAFRARWFIAYAALFVVAGVLFAWLGFSGSAIYGYRGFVKAFAGLVHLALLFVPLMALVPAAGALSDERESGALDYILAQPVTFGEVYAGKWLGVSLAMMLCLTIGFGATAILALGRGVPIGLIGLLYGYVLLLALVFVALGLLLSTVTDSRARAVTLGLVLWLVLAALGTLGLMIAFVRWGLPEAVLAVWTFLNPTEAFRLGVVTSLDRDVSLLGPVGANVVGRFGALGTMGLAASVLLLWAGAAGIAGWRIFQRGR